MDAGAATLVIGEISMPAPAKTAASTGAPKALVKGAIVKGSRIIFRNQDHKP